MVVNQEFICSNASVIGSTHRNNFKNNQDASWVIGEENSIVALVGDGCGSGANSEVGSKLILPNIALNISQLIYLGETIEKSIQQSLQSAKSMIRALISNIPLPFNEAIEQFFLFTIMGAVVTRDETIVFSMGDGVYSVNGSVHVIDQNNAPNYLAYTVINDKDPEYVINVKMPTEAVESILIASDGAADIIKNQDQQYKFGLAMKQVGHLNQFVDDKRLRGSSVQMKKLLNVFSKQNIVSDDTTIVTVVRTPKGE